MNLLPNKSHILASSFTSSNLLSQISSVSSAINLGRLGCEEEVDS